MKLYAYIRVSTGLQDYQAQRSSIKKRFPDIDEWVEDTGSGKKTQVNLLSLIAKAQPEDHIIVYAFDRLGRNTGHVVEIVERLKKRGIRITSIREGLDINSASGNMVFQMMCSIAEFEATMISDRVRQGLQAAKERGVQLGSPSLFVKYPNMPEIVDFAKRLRAEGVPYQVIREFIYRDYNVWLSYGSVQKYIHMDKQA